MIAPCANDERWMRLALSLGARGLGRTWPNPAVGCVIVKDGRVLGRGWTQPSGRPHAERMALAQAGKNASGATAYVTLEPCAHTGKTPPCAQGLIDAKITRVVSAMTDPDPRVAGKGHAMLRAAGISVTTDVCADQAAYDHAGFLLKTTQNRPMVTLKLASSLDAKIATKTGESQWITAQPAREYVHALRANHDAIMIGRATAVADNPRLNVRLAGLQDRAPVRVVLDSQLKTPATGNLVENIQYQPLWIIHGNAAQTDAWAQTGAELIKVPTTNNQGLCLPDVLQELAARGITRLFCEGGGQLAASLLGAGLVDRLITMTAGIAIGADGTPNLASLGVSNLSDAPRFELDSLRQLGPDVIAQWNRA